MSELAGRLGGTRDAENGEPAEELNGRWLRRRMAGDVAVVTTVTAYGLRGATVTACAVVSEAPLMILIALGDENQMTEWIQESRVFALNLLPWREQFLADQFAGLTPRAHATFAGIPYSRGGTGSPLLTRAIAAADCRLVQTVATGDHICLVGEAAGIYAGEGDELEPLLHYLSRYRRLG